MEEERSEAWRIIIELILPITAPVIINVSFFISLYNAFSDGLNIVNLLFDEIITVSDVFFWIAIIFATLYIIWNTYQLWKDGKFIEVIYYALGFLIGSLIRIIQFWGIIYYNNSLNAVLFLVFVLVGMVVLFYYTYRIFNH